MPLPYTDMKTVKEVLKYRKQKDANGNLMSFRKIAEKMTKEGEKPKDVKTVYKWYLKGIGKMKMRVKV